MRSRPDASIVMAAADVAAGRLRCAREPRFDRRDDDRGSVRAEAHPIGAAARRSPLRSRRRVASGRCSCSTSAPTPTRGPPISSSSPTSGRRSRRPCSASRSPGSGLLSVGAEAKKGSVAVVEAHETLAASGGIRFAGNVEGRELLDPDVEVLVTDGFTGNVVLKTIEGTAKSVADAVRAAARSGPRAAAGGLDAAPGPGRAPRGHGPRRHRGRDPARPARRRRRRPRILRERSASPIRSGSRRAR